MQRHNHTLLLLIVSAFLMQGCGQTSSVERNSPRISYDSSEDVTMYRTPQMRLTHELHLTRHPINLTISGGCEGEETHCRPDHVLWEFDAPPEYAQYLGTDRIDFVVDGQYHTFQTNMYQGRVSERSASQRARFRIPFAFTDRLSRANSVTIKLGGNDIRLDDRRREVIRTFVETVQRENRS